MSPLVGALIAGACGVAFAVLLVWGLCEAAKHGDRQLEEDNLKPKASGVHVRRVQAGMLGIGADWSHDDRP